MPGPYVHISAMRHTAARLHLAEYLPARSARINPYQSGPGSGELARALSDYPNFAALGAIGPDLFFFLPDFRDVSKRSVSSPLIAILDFLDTVESKVGPYVDKWEHYLGPVSEGLGEEMSRLTGGLSESTNRIVTELKDILVQLIEDFAATQKDWWGYFSLGLDKGYDEKAYLWSDELHYSHTGLFGRTLWDTARHLNDGAAKAYALGYVTHLATDVTGHGFVNEISGGPFRTHWQRHHLVENHVDAAWYLMDTDANERQPGYSDYTDSAIYYDIAFDPLNSGAPVQRPHVPTGRSLRENWQRKRMLDQNSTLPDNVIQLLLDTMATVFPATGPHPQILKTPDGRPTPELVQQAYGLLFRYLKISTVDGLAHDPPPPPDIYPNLDFPTMSDPAGDLAPGESDGSWDDILDFLLAAAAVLIYIAEVAAWVATVPWAVVADTVTYPLRLGLYYSMELPLFHMLKNFRAVLVKTGYLHPQPDEISQALINVGNAPAETWLQVLSQVDDVFGGTVLTSGDKPDNASFRDQAYPHQTERAAPPNNQPTEFRHPWDYPTSSVELAGTTAGPAATDASPASLFAQQAQDEGIRERLEVATTPNEVDEVNLEVTPSRHLGDTVTFCQYLTWLVTREQDTSSYEQPAPAMVDWNLDADRGYGYHCWDWDRSTRATSKDPEGRDFLTPLVWPPQAADDPAPPGAVVHTDQPLKLHWSSQSPQAPTTQPSVSLRKRRRP